MSAKIKPLHIQEKVLSTSMMYLVLNSYMHRFVRDLWVMYASWVFQRVFIKCFVITVRRWVWISKGRYVPWNRPSLGGHHFETCCLKTCSAKQKVCGFPFFVPENECTFTDLACVVQRWSWIEKLVFWIRILTCLFFDSGHLWFFLQGWKRKLWQRRHLHWTVIKIDVFFEFSRSFQNAFVFSLAWWA